MQTLERKLGLFAVITISLSSMIGSGIFVLPGLGFTLTGPSIYLAFILSALCILPAAISKAELATAMPTSGGTYVYLERTFGPLVGTISGLGLFLSILLKASFALIGMGAYFSVFSSYPLIPTVLCFLVLIGILNIFGVGKVSGILSFILFLTLVGLALISVFSIPTWEAQNLTPFLTNGIEGLASATGFVFVSYAGVTKVAAIAEEVVDPDQNLPKGILLSLLIVTIVYSLTSFVLAGNFPSSEMAGNLKPLFELAHKVGGKTAGIIIAVVATLTMMNTANAGVLAGSRFPFAMSRDKLLPKFLGKLHPKFFTPTMSIVLSVIIIATILLSFDVAKIAKLASAFMILIYLLENVAVIVLRESRVQWYTPGYKSPLYPFLQIIGIIASLGLLVAMGSLAFFAIIGIAIPGALLYFVYSRKKTTRIGLVGMRSKREDIIETTKTKLDNISSGLMSDAHVVISLFGKERSPEMLVEMGAALVNEGRVEVVRVQEIPEQITAEDVDETAEMNSLRRRIKAMAEDKEKKITFDSIVCHDLSKTMYELSSRLHSRWMFVEWHGHKHGVTLHDPIGWLKSHLHCHLATFRDVGVRYIREILVYINEDRNDSLVIDTANYLGRVNNAKVTLAMFCDGKNQEEVNEKQIVLEKLAKEVSSIKCNTEIVTGDNKVLSIEELTVNYDLLILGSSDHSMKKYFGKSFDDKLISRAACSVLAVHASSFDLD